MGIGRSSRNEVKCGREQMAHLILLEGGGTSSGVSVASSRWGERKKNLGDEKRSHPPRL